MLTTLIYYVSSILLKILVFSAGTFYFWYRDRRDKERCVKEDREYQNRRDQADRRREWRQFAERIYTDYSKLKSKDIPQKISKVKNTFEHMLIHSTVSGLDVLRYMLTDDNYRNFASESPQLKALREDLHMIFLPLNICSSLFLLGEVPINIKEELRLVVEELGNLAEPFLTGEQQRVALKCLKYFGSNRSSNAVTEHAQRGVEELVRIESQRRVEYLERVKAIAPYVNSLQFGCSDAKNFPKHSAEVDVAMEDCDYSQCRKFSFNSTETMIKESHEIPEFLKDLQKNLENETHSARIFSNQPGLPFASIERIRESDTDEDIFMKVLHEVRLYIHLIQSEGLTRVLTTLRVKENIERLKELHSKKTEVKHAEESFKRHCKDFIRGLEKILNQKPPHLIKQEFASKLKNLYEDLLIHKRIIDMEHET